MPHTVLIVDHYSEYRQYVRKLLQEYPDLTVVGEAEGGAVAVQKAKELQPDIVLLDVDLPELSGLAAISLILEASPESEVIFVTQISEPEIIRAAFAKGASAYLTKVHFADEVATALRCVLQGMFFLGNNPWIKTLADTESQ